MPDIKDLQKDSPEFQTLAILLAKIAVFGIPLKPVKVEAGPVVTTYFFTPIGNTTLSKVQARNEDIAIAIGKESVTIEKSGFHICIAAPNSERKFVDFKDYLFWYLRSTEQSEGLVERDRSIPIPLGTDSRGAYATLDLTECPHILIAGQTGSGKSVFEAAILASLATRFSSDELHLYLADAKQVDLSLFKTLPHTKAFAKNSEEFVTFMKDLLIECGNRLAKFSQLGVRNIKEHTTKTGTALPYIVVMIDELAQMMEQDKNKRKGMDKEEKAEATGVPEILKTMAQISRAAGIHIIACTQRSSVETISGDIKVNFPCRIALKLPSYQDSRTILEEDGAQYLLGKGDMFVKLPNKDNIERYHGPFVRLEDIRYVVENLEQVRQITRG